MGFTAEVPDDGRAVVGLTSPQSLLGCRPLLECSGMAFAKGLMIERRAHGLLHARFRLSNPSLRRFVVPQALRRNIERAVFSGVEPEQTFAHQLMDVAGIHMASA